MADLLHWTQVCFCFVLIRRMLPVLFPLGFLGFALVDDNLYDEGDDDNGSHDQPEIISIHNLQYYGCLFPLQQAVQTFLLSLFCSTLQNRLRKSKNDKKEKNVTNELVFVGILYVQVD